MAKALYVDPVALQKKIEDSGLRIRYLHEVLGISRQGFDKKRKGRTPFRVSEVFVLCTLLHIDKDERMKIFYPKEQPEGLQFADE